MAKKKMLCPFSKELCRECAQYRGRHYYLCYCSKYRGYLGTPEEPAEQKSWHSAASQRFDMPLRLPTSSTWLVLNEFAERKEK